MSSPQLQHVKFSLHVFKVFNFLSVFSNMALATAFVTQVHWKNQEGLFANRRPNLAKKCLLPFYSVTGVYLIHYVQYIPNKINGVSNHSSVHFSSHVLLPWNPKYSSSSNLAVNGHDHNSFCSCTVVKYIMWSRDRWFLLTNLLFIICT